MCIQNMLLVTSRFERHRSRICSIKAAYKTLSALPCSVVRSSSASMPPPSLNTPHREFVFEHHIKNVAASLRWLINCISSGRATKAVVALALGVDGPMAKPVSPRAHYWLTAAAGQGQSITRDALGIMRSLTLRRTVNV